MGSLGSPGDTYATPKRDTYIKRGPFSTSRKQRSRTDGGSCSKRPSLGKGSPGRFIPRRFSMDMEVANFSLQSPFAGSNDWSNEVFEDTQSWGCSSARQQRKRLASLSQGASEKRILNFGAQPFQHKEFPQGSRQDRSSVDQMEQTFRKPARKLPTFPVHVLDLPKLADDFFTHTMCWSSDGHLVAGLGNRLYTCSPDCEGTTLLQDLPSSRSYTAVACNASGNLLAASTDDYEVQIWDLTTLKLVNTIVHTHHRDGSRSTGKLSCRLISLDWSPKADLLAVGCGFGVIEVVDVRLMSGKQVIMNDKDLNCISGLRFSPNGAYLAASNSRHMITVWDTANFRTSAPLFSRNAHTSAIRALSWFPWKNSILASGGGIDDGFIRLWNVHTGEKIEEIAVNAQVCQVLWSPETKELLTSQSVYDKHSVVVWDYPGLTKLGSLGGHTGRVLHMALSPKKTQLATAAADETLRIWKLKSSLEGSDTKRNTRNSDSSFLQQGIR